jgi:hypothetical protein
MAVAKTGDDRTAPDKAGMKWRAAGDGFFDDVDTPTTTAENIGRDQSNVGKETGCPG